MNGISKNWYLKSYQSLLLKYIYELIRKLTIKSLKGDFTLRNFQWTVTTGVSISIKYVFTIQVSCIPNFILLALLPDIFKVGVGLDGIYDTGAGVIWAAPREPINGRIFARNPRTAQRGFRAESSRPF